MEPGRRVPATGTILGCMDPAAAAVWGNDVRTDIGSLASSLSYPHWIKGLGGSHLLLSTLRTHGFTHTIAKGKKKGEKKHFRS